MLKEKEIMQFYQFLQNNYPEIGDRNLDRRSGFVVIRLFRGREYARAKADEIRKCSDVQKVRCSEVSFTQGQVYEIKVDLKF